jgi:hypothetical protein
VGQIGVAPHRVDEVVAADPIAIAVATDHDNPEIMVAQASAGRDRQGAPVQRVVPIGRHVVGQLAAAADAGDHQHLVRIEVQAGKRLLDAGEDGEVAAARAPGRLLVDVE